MKILACLVALSFSLSSALLDAGSAKAQSTAAEEAHAVAPFTPPASVAAAAVIAAVSRPSSASAGQPPDAAGAAAPVIFAAAPEELGRAVELNLLFAFVGIFDMKLLLPVVRAGARDLRGELIFGAYSDYSWGPLSRPADEYGKVLLLAGRVGYRQNLVRGLHVEASTYLGWRHEEENVHDGRTVDGFVGRLWLYGGWQRDLSPRFYANVRGGLGIHLFRTDHLGHKEKELVPAGDLGLGVRF